MSEKEQESPVIRALAGALRRALRPFARLFLRHGLPFKVFAEVAKEVFVEVAARDFALEDRRTTDSRISVLTGLTRKDVRRLRAEGAPDEQAVAAQFNRAARVTTAWLRQSRYHGVDGSPAALPFEGEGATFSELVRAHSGDMTPRAVLDELVRVGAVVVDQDGHVRLAARGYVPSRDEIAKLGILGEDVEALAATVEHNIDAAPADRWFQRKVTYDNLPAEALEELRRSAGRRGQALLESLDGEIAPLDRDQNPGRAGTGRKKIIVGVYWWEGDVDEEESS